MKKNEILEDFFSRGPKKKRENEEGIRYKMKESWVISIPVKKYKKKSTKKCKNVSSFHI